MPLEIRINDRVSTVKLLEQNKNQVKIAIDDRVYDLDIANVERGVYSILYKNRSYNVELIQGDNTRHYLVNTAYQSLDVEIKDAQSRYQENRKKGSESDGANTIVSPMPGKVVRTLVAEGDNVESGQPVIVLSAMKMESEYKSGVSGVVKKIYVKEGETVNGGQILVVIE